MTKYWTEAASGSVYFGLQFGSTVRQNGEVEAAGA